ncbi:hypothetical protein Rsub_04475 [Raphidocelis subcapitata]|uniref:Uncharacterized protein n=1 Tax=Raphidocelis subcapitata TaxID=307507 RepID=A0A2V0NWV9_9CHLO|nr:hypothetical protein Rsub_04475 [Raphidocelis subcapitata]|eukprot:GBF92128.1 hypothetical protein Rsub_04475 [Raphidocelis subcapitata]
MALTKAKLAPTACCATPGRGAYRRSRTTSAPRKRTALNLFSCYGSLRHPATELYAAHRLDCLDAGCGGPGGRQGSGNGGNGGAGGNGWGAGAGGEGSPLNRNGAVALAAALGAAALLAAASDAPRRDGREDGLPGLLALPGLATPGAFADAAPLVVAPSHAEVLPGPSKLTRGEVELYLPRQYHIRECVYIH